MTVSVQASSELILGDGVNTSFDFSYIGAIAVDNQVTWTQSDGTITVLDPSQYTLTLNAAVPGQIWGIGGVLVFPLSGSPIPVGDTLLVQRVLPYTQETSISNQGAFYPEAVEAALDILCFEIQQLRTQIQFGTSSSSTGNVVGPGTSSNYGVAYFIGTNGQRLGSTLAGTPGYVLTGRNGTQPPNFQLPPGQANGILSVSIYPPGVYVITPPTGATLAGVTLQGGGGGGEGAAGNPGTGKVAIGSGGSGGGWLQTLVTASTLDGETLTVGDQGLGGAAGNNNGADGEDTTLLALVAEGGLGGILGLTSSSPPVNAHSMAGGGVTGGDTSRPGGPSGNELTTSTSAAFGGSGGDSQLSPGTAAAVATTNSQTNGANAAGFGGGGGGGVVSGTGTSASGGNGSSGSTTIIWYGFQSATASAVGEATQAQQEAGVLGTVYVSPRNQQWHYSALKVEGYIAADGTVLQGYNIASCTRSSEGVYVITFSASMASTSYAAVATPDET